MAADAGVSERRAVLIYGVAKLPKKFRANLPPKPVVNTGFSTPEHPDDDIGPEHPLRSGDSYFFWLEVSAPIAESLERSPTGLPIGLPSEHLPERAELTVALFAFDGEIEIDREVTGTIRLEPDGSAVVRTEAARTELSEKMNQRLFFPVKMPPRSGTFRLRCNIYYRQILVQSRLIEVTLFGWFRSLVFRWLREHFPEAARRRLNSSELESSLSGSLDAERLSSLPPTH